MSKIGYNESLIPEKSVLPDPQVKQSVMGANVSIQKVGVNEVECPIKVKGKNGDIIKLKGVFSSYVSLAPGKKGINMSRLPRTIYEHMLEKCSEVGVEGLVNIARDLVSRLGSTDSYIKVKFDYPMWQNSLLSKNENGEPYGAYAYYPCEFEVKCNKQGQISGYLTLIFHYSSSCPCSDQLAQEAVKTYAEAAIPHSQRSTAKTTVQIDLDKDFWIEDLVMLHRDALKTEVNYAPVRREDEMHFAVLSGLYPKFVEDAARLVYGALIEADYPDFVGVFTHYESLHRENAVSVIYKGIPDGLR